MEEAVSAFLALFLIALLSLLLFFSTGRKTSPSHSHIDGRSLPPSPPGFPLLGHLPLLIGSSPHRKLRAMAAAHGPVMLVRLGRVPAVVVSSATGAEEAMKTRDPAFASRSRSRMVDRLFYGCDMAFAPYGEHWRRGRRVCVLHLLSHRRVASFRRIREQEAAALVARVRGGAVNLSDLLISYSSAVIFRAAFGDRSSYGLAVGGGGGELRKVFDDLEELMGSGTLGELVPWLAWVDALRGLDTKATRTFEALDGLLEQVIADHRERRKPPAIACVL